MLLIHAIVTSVSSVTAVAIVVIVVVNDFAALVESVPVAALFFIRMFRLVKGKGRFG